MYVVCLVSEVKGFWVDKSNVCVVFFFFWVYYCMLLSCLYNCHCYLGQGNATRRVLRWRKLEFTWFLATFLIWKAAVTTFTTGEIWINKGHQLQVWILMISKTSVWYHLHPCVTRFSQACLLYLDWLDWLHLESWRDPSFPQNPKNSALLPQEHQIRRSSDERNKGILRSAHSRVDGVLVEGLQLGKSWYVQIEGLTTGIIRYGPELKLT